jgi:D-alanyl-lipoteichoic acid acyltransferase DltB (MBOAT superfamily)
MLFSSPTFIAFFVVYFCFHLIVPRQYRVYLIICGSTIFYAWWKVAYAWLPYLLMAIAYFGVQWMERTDDPIARKRRMITTVVVLFFPLAVFKYTDFIYRDVIGPFFAWDGKLLDVPLPLGVSFVTFTLTAYLVDIYHAKFPAEQRPATVLAYVLFFPHLIAGPILRPVELIPQLDHPRPAWIVRAIVPIAIFTLGLVKKLVFADQIAEAVDSVYAPGSVVTGSTAVLAIYGFSIQIYCDFSGYTDMAIGLALMLGVRLPQNFLRPYCAHSPVEFWRRWHVTLSFWLRDYLYIPLGGSRHGRLKEIRNILITMALGGLWHGASWTFVIWGLLHGFAVAAIHQAQRVLGTRLIAAIPTSIKIVLTFHFVTVAWIFFRAPSLGKAVEIIAAPFVGRWDDLMGVVSQSVFPVLLIAIALSVHRFDDHRRVKAAVRHLRPEIIWPVIVLCWVLAITVSQGSSAKFIYFDF